mgnify:CR=1 FL=1
MNSVKVDNITIEHANGEYFIYVPEEVVNRVTIVAKNSGKHGLVSPDIGFKLSDIVRNAHIKAGKALMSCYDDNV